MTLSGAKPITFIITRDYARAKAFYSGLLGLDFVAEDPFALIYDLAGTTLRISQVPDFVAQQHSVLGWQVADIDAVAKALLAGGVTFNIYPGMGQDETGIWTAPGGAKIAFFNDPDGNVLSVTQPPA